MSGLSLGIDFGSRGAKIIVAGGTATRTSLLHASSFALGDGFVKELRGWVRERNLTGVRAVVSIPAHEAVLRWVMLPNVRGDERRDAARFKVKRHLPFPVEDAYVEATAPDSNEEGVASALVIAVRRELVERRAEVAASAGLVPVAAELDAQGILRVTERRLQERSRVWRNASLTVLDIGSERTQMVVVQNQEMQFLRSVRFGVQQLTDAVAETLNVTVGEAETYLAHPGCNLRLDGKLVIDSPDEALILDVNPILERLTRECLRLLRYFRSLHPERSYAGILDHMVLSGGAAGLRGLAEYLSGFLKLRVEPVRPFAGLAANIDGEAFRRLTLSQETYTVALGLALSGLESAVADTKEGESERQFLWQRRA